MPVTRAKATTLLNQKEMELFDASRSNGLRQLDDKALAAHIVRARTARDRARDLLKRQKLASRARTGSKRGASGDANQRSKDKADLLADILSRFEDHKKASGKQPARKAAPKKAVTRKTTATKAATRKATAKKTTEAAKSPAKAGKPTTRKTAAKRGTGAKTAARTSAPKKATAGKKTSSKRVTGAAAKKTAAKAPARKAAGTAKPATVAKRKAPAKRTASAARKITPRQALKQTRRLLEEKNARNRQPGFWQHISDAVASITPAPGYQSISAARRAERLHAAESRRAAIMGSSSTRDRINQGKRDHRGDGNDS